MTVVLLGRAGWGAVQRRLGPGVRVPGSRSPGASASQPPSGPHGLGSGSRDRS